jgi:site-specific DNA-methyltransferase (adenine-specific)
MAKRLMIGLETQIPDKQKRINHIFSQQLYGIAITDLTALLSRRSVYCSKVANGKYSVYDGFNDDQGNIKYQRMNHTWHAGKCTYCGANQTEYDRDESLETYAYNFLHTDNPEKIFNMKFDVIVGNPPYQLSDGGFGTSATPIYHKFVEQAKKLEPKYLSFVIPARWFSGGMGLDEFRAGMLGDNRISTIVDFPDSNDVFPGTQIKGGVCYFLWNKEYSGNVSVSTHDKGQKGNAVVRPLLEKGADIFIRYNEALPILKKVIGKETGQSITSNSISIELPDSKKFMKLVSSIGAFGLESTFRGKEKQSNNDLKVYRNSGIGYLPKSELTKEKDIVNSRK